MTSRNGHGECFYCKTPREIGEDCECDGGRLEIVTAQRDALLEMGAQELTECGKLLNVAACVMKYTQIKREHNGRGKPKTYEADVDSIANAARQLAEMVQEYLLMEARP